MAGLWDAFCTTVQETVEDLQERLPKDLTDHLRRDIPKRLQKVLETGLPDIEIKDEPAARLLGALGAVAPPPAGPLISARGWDEPSTSSSRAPEPEEQNGDGVGEEVSCQSECEDSVNGETMPQHPAEVESHVPPAPDFKDGENGLWGSFCTAVKETVGDLQERLPKDLTDHLREDIPERLQKNLAKGFQSIQIKDERALQLLGALGAVTPQPAGPLISGETMLQHPAGGEVLVSPAPEFKEGEDVYRMSANPRGKCIIINNEKFENHPEPRIGSRKDVDNMKKLFAALHFHVHLMSDLKAAKMKAMLSAEAEDQRYKSSDCLVVMIMSHGLGDKIEGVDGEYLDLMDDVYGLFNNDNCPALQGKPKIFFIQACRGGKDDNGCPAVNANADTSSDGQKPPMPPTSCPPSDERMSSWSDMFFAHATIPRYVAHRNREIGSWFISSVYDVFRREASTMHLQDMMRLVEKEIIAKSAHDGGRQTASTSTWAWTKTLYFNPGHFR